MYWKGAIRSLYAQWSEIESSQTRKETVSLGYITGRDLKKDFGKTEFFIPKIKNIKNFKQIIPPQHSWNRGKFCSLESVIGEGW